MTETYTYYYITIITILITELILIVSNLEFSDIPNLY